MSVFTRREFLRTAAAAAVTGFPTFVSSRALGASGAVAANSRVGVGCVGVGPQGRGVMGNFLGQARAQVVAVCDPLQRNRDAAIADIKARYAGAGPAVCASFEELFARKDIDAVLIATPDHWHVPAALAAAQAGKDIYLEKPMGLSVEEDQLLRLTCQRNGRIFQFGTQQRSERNFRRACELVRNGRIGKLKQINVWSAASRPGGPAAPVEPPPGLDYDRWLGPVPKTPYTDGKAFDTQTSWKTWWYNSDYALGFIAGWGVHPLDIALWGHPALMSAPMEIEGRGVIPAQGACNTAIAWDVHFTFGDGVTMRYRSTPNETPPGPLHDLSDWKAKYGRLHDHGTAFEGSEGWVLVDRNGLWTSPESLIEEKPDSFKIRLPQSSHHVGNLLESIQSRKPAICPIEEAVQADVLCHVSDIAVRLNRKLKFDPLTETFPGDTQASRRLAKRA